jgi:leucine dehydrogenase
MSIFDEIQKREHEQVAFCSDAEIGLKAIIAIHNTTLGPALGGTRMWTYTSDDEALRDALRLSRGMTYKAAIAGLNLGGGKAVIIGDPEKEKSEPLFRAYGRFVDSLGGRYITAEDVGTSERDMEWVSHETRHVTGTSKARGGSGDPSPVTGFGVYVGMKAAANVAYGSDSLEGKKVSIQGAGKVASYLAEHLAKDGAVISCTDINEDRAKQLAAKVGGTYVDPDSIYGQDVDIFAPCALGAILNDETIPALKCRIVAGGANNQLLEEQKHASMLAKRDILYAPDYAINAGGLMNVANELEGHNPERALTQAKGIYDIIRDIFRISSEENVLTTIAANKLAEQRIHNIGRIKRVYTGSRS